MSYKNAPIIEAMIDFRINPSEKINLSTLTKVTEQIKKKYPHHSVIENDITTVSHAKQETTFNNKREKIGYKLTSDNLKHVAQIKTNGFTFSVINSYDNGDHFLKEAKYIWEKYCTELKPTNVTRIALRYINRIDIPALTFKLEDYFNTYPHVFKDNPIDLSAFFMQVQMPQSEGGMVILNQAVTNPPSPGYTSILLDIDVFDLKIFESNSKELWERIELLRMQKNKIFEESITNKTQELFL